MEFPVWRQRLRAAQQREGRSPSSRWLQLASVALDGTARVRTLVFRGWCGDRQLNLYTDQRSAKCDELRHQPHVELCWLMPKAKEFAMDTCNNGEERAFVVTGQYEPVFPFDIYPVQLLKSIIANDIDALNISKYLF